MANPARGEVPLQVGDKTYTLLWGTTAQCAVEGVLKMGFAEMAPMLDRVTVARALLWACLLRHHKFSAPEEIDDLMDEIGLEVVRDAVVRAITAGSIKPSGENSKKA